MDVQQVKEKRDALECDIKMLIEVFEKDTDVRVTSVELFVSVVGPFRHIEDIDAHVEL